MQVDVTVVGAGMVGLAMARQCQQMGMNIALIEKSPVSVKWPSDSLPLRVSAISPASQHLLTQLGAWSGIEKEAAPYENMFVWDAQSEAKITLTAEYIHQAYLGHIIANRVIQKHLYQALDQAEMSHLIPDQIGSLQPKPDGWQLHLASGKMIDTKLLIGADGANSSLRQQMGIASPVTFYQQKAIVAVVKTALPHQATAWQRFLPTGPLAFLPLSDPHQCSIVWSLDETHFESINGLDNAAFCQQLAQALEQKLGAIELLTDRAAFPLKHHHCKTYVKPHFALIGDAAHSIHPLAGQGVNLGLLDVQALSKIIQQAKARQRPLGLVSDLKRYQQKRRWHNEVMLQSMTLFNALFKQTDPVTKMVRQFGVNQVDSCHVLKKYLIEQATGRSLLKEYS